MSDEQGSHVGHISQGGQALLRVKAEQGTLTLRWGSGEEQSCQFTYTVPDDKPGRRRNPDADTDPPMISAASMRPAWAGAWRLRDMTDFKLEKRKQ